MRLFSFLDFEAKKKSKSDFRTPLAGGPNVRYNTPPLIRGLKPPIKYPKFPSFEFWLKHCIGIIENNISTKFGDNRTNFGEIITISRFQCFLYSSGHSARGTSIVSTLLSLKNF